MENLLHELERVSDELARRVDDVPLLRRLTEGTIEDEEMLVFLVQTYHYVAWTEPLLAAAGERLSALGAEPRWCALFAEKGRGEHKHERWLLADARRLGFSEADVLATRPSRAVEAYIAYNRAIVAGDHPLSYLGTAWTLERLALDRAGRATSALARRPGARAASATIFLRGHAEEDIGHVADLARILGSVSEPRDRSGILTAARATAELYPSFFDVPFAALEEQRRARPAA